MAFFKSTRDRLKVNALMSNLEFAKTRWEFDPFLGLQHLKSARKAVLDVAKCESQAALTFEGWQYIVSLTCEVALIALAPCPNEEIDEHCQLILSFAKKWRDAATE